MREVKDSAEILLFLLSIIINLLLGIQTLIKTSSFFLEIMKQTKQQSLLNVWNKRSKEDTHQGKNV